MWLPYHQGNYARNYSASESASAELPPLTKWTFAEVAEEFIRSDAWGTEKQQEAGLLGPAATTNSVLQKVLSQGQDVAVEDREVWSEDTPLVEAIRDARLFYLGPESSTNDLSKAGTIGDADSVHYGGSASLGKVIDPETFKPFGLDGVRVADLSAFKEPTPGNTMAAAYTIGHFVAKFLVSNAALPEPLSTEKEKARLAAKRSSFAWHKYKTELASEGFEFLYLPDGSNFHRPIVDDGTFASTTSGTPDPKLPCVVAAAVERCTTPRSLDSGFEEALTPKEAVYAKPDEFALCSRTRSTLAIARTDLVDYELRFSARIPPGGTPAVVVMGQVEPNSNASAPGPRLDGVAIPVRSPECYNSCKAWNRFTLLVNSGKDTVGLSVNGAAMEEIPAPAAKGRRLGFVFDGDGEMCYRDIMLKEFTTSDTPPSPTPPKPSLTPTLLPLPRGGDGGNPNSQQLDWLLALSGAAVTISCISLVILLVKPAVKHYQTLKKTDEAPAGGRQAPQAEPSQEPPLEITDSPFPDAPSDPPGRALNLGQIISTPSLRQEHLRT